MAAWSPPTITAHFGHWWTSLLYVVPVVAIAGWLGLQQWRENRRRD
jgi:hypothetical protein